MIILPDKCATAGGLEPDNVWCNESKTPSQFPVSIPCYRSTSEGLEAPDRNDGLCLRQRFVEIAMMLAREVGPGASLETDDDRSSFPKTTDK
jgi:hypothetical protein